MAFIPKSISIVLLIQIFIQISCIYYGHSYNKRKNFADLLVQRQVPLYHRGRSIVHIAAFMGLTMCEEYMHLSSFNARGHYGAACGTIQRLWRYPVKSMLGETCGTLTLNTRGVEGDRLFALRTLEGKFGSGKSTRRFQYVPGLFDFYAVYQGDVPVITFPDGRTIAGDDPSIHAHLSQSLGQPVTLTKENAISHFDAGSIHILTTAALAWLRTNLPGHTVNERRFRPNIVINVPDATHIEQHWCGRMLALGDVVRIRVRATTERCGMVGFAQADLLKDLQILRYIAQEAGLQFGVYGEVVLPGQVVIGDPVSFAH